MKKKRTHTNRLIFSTAAIMAAGILIYFWFCTDRTLKEPPETESSVFTESAASKTEYPEEPATERAKPDTADNPAPTTETMLIQETDRIRSLPAGEIAEVQILTPEQISSLFFAEELNDAVFTRINGLSYTENPNVKRSDLSYLKMLYYGFDGNTYVGEMIVNQKIESDILQIFRTLYENKYPIEKMVLIDNYDASDTLSMEDNNTSAFNYRTISGSDKLSNHSYGMAIDLNPKYNPYVKTASDGSVTCQPESGREYADRSKDFAYKIDENDLAYRLFTEAGFTWGGNWNNVKDYQHFEK